MVLSILSFHFKMHPVTFMTTIYLPIICKYSYPFIACKIDLWLLLYVIVVIKLEVGLQKD